MRTSQLAVSLLAALTCSAWTYGADTPVKLAIINQEESASTLVDLLTVEVSKNEEVTLLDRADIDRVYREQGLSSGNEDYMKLGQVLGADGLLLLDLGDAGTNKVVNTRLVAVKPGVIMRWMQTPWPVSTPLEWAAGVAAHLKPLLPKLSVLEKDAIPISVVNLRSAVSSQEADALERQLTVLTIERLTREREVFVLERRQMDLLSAEKDLQTTGRAEFWNGSFLLEGVIDRDGYAKDRVTVHVQLARPQGGSPIEIAIESSRTNTVSLVEQLTSGVLKALEHTSTSQGWDPEQEAARFYEEACWALKWGMVGEAQNAAEAAWALGRRDLECAMVRIKSYLPGVVPDTRGYHTKTTMYGPGMEAMMKKDAAGQ